jgi:NTE family protein
LGTTTTTETAKRRERPTIGLALGGGGARGYAHIGVIRTLERHGIPIDVVAGTSMGAVMGGAYACGVDMEKIKLLLRSLDLNRLLGFPRSSIRGLALNAATEYLFKRRDWRRQDLESTASVIEFFSVFTQGKSFEELGLRFAVMAVDIDTGEEVVIREGPVARAMAAGIVLPGVQYPVNVGGRYVVDGGLVNRVPADVAFELGADVVIAVDVSAGLFVPGAVTSLEVLFQAESIMLQELTRLRLELLRERVGERFVVLYPPVDDVKTLSLNEVDLPVRAGEEETERRLAEIRALIAAAGRAPADL